MLRHALRQLVGLSAVLVLGGLLHAAEPAAPESAKNTSPATHPPEKLNAPFTLTAKEQKSVDAILARWEKWNAGVKTFECRFKRWTYDSIFGTPVRPMFVELGTIKYAAPDMALFSIESSEKDEKQIPIEDQRSGHWMFDGKAIWEYDSAKKQVVEYKLPPNWNAKLMIDGPLSFSFPTSMFTWIFLGSSTEPIPSPFSSNPEVLKRQFFLRIVTPADVKDQIWLEVYPRLKHQAGCFQKLQLIFMESDMKPFALKIVQPNGKDYSVFQFYDIQTNHSMEPIGFPKSSLRVPPGWKLICDTP
jgi:TIGR03009 family protein